MNQVVRHAAGLETFVEGGKFHGKPLWGILMRYQYRHGGFDRYEQVRFNEPTEQNRRYYPKDFKLPWVISRRLHEKQYLAPSVLLG